MPSWGALSTEKVSHNKAFFQEMIPKKFQISKILSTIIICVSLIYETTLENTEWLEPHDSPLMY